MSLSVVLFLPSCTGEAPTIQSVRYYTIASYNPETDERSEALSLFLNVSHDDGEQELSEWIVSHEESDLYWELTADSWQRRRWDERYWIGSSELRAPDGETLPRGTYSVGIVDRGGREAASEFELRTLDFSVSDADFPRLQAPNDGDDESAEWVIDHGGDRLFVTLLADDGSVLAQREVDDGRVRREDFDISEDDSIATVYLQELRERSEVWLVSGPWQL